MVTGDGAIHQLFDAESGRLVLVCRDTETFERLRAVLCREAGVGPTINIPPAPVRSVALELAEQADPASVGVGARLGAWGCVALLAAAGVVFLVGLLVIVERLRG